MNEVELVAAMQAEAATLRRKADVLDQAVAVLEAPLVVPAAPRASVGQKRESRERRTFTDDEKRRAVRLVRDIGLAKASKRLGIVRSVLQRWVYVDDHARGGRRGGVRAPSGPAPGPPPVPAARGLAERIRDDTAVIEAQRKAINGKAAAMVSSGVRHAVDHEAARRAAYPRDEDPR